MFEPFHPGKVEAYAAYNEFQYMRVAEDDPELLLFCRRIFRGEVRHPWIDREARHRSADVRLVKDVRANLMLAWIRARFPEIPLVLVLRHPCAVVLSRLRLGWATDEDIQPMLRQPALVEDFLGARMRIVESARSPAAKHALIWCIHNLVPMTQLESAELAVVRYEDLCRDPSVAIPRLFGAIRRPFGDSVFRSARMPSLTSRPESAVVSGHDPVTEWQGALPPAAVRDVLSVVEAFGLGHLYEDVSTGVAAAGTS
jgi:hypothetical protein